MIALGAGHVDDAAYPGLRRQPRQVCALVSITGARYMRSTPARASGRVPGRPTNPRTTSTESGRPSPGGVDRERADVGGTEREQLVDDQPADSPGSAGNEDLHVAPLLSYGLRKPFS
nr:hypothetical protein GCM10020092_016950 [Actinoplanes digitatis]